MNSDSAKESTAPTSTATGACLLTVLPVFRFFNNNAGGHFYTINEAERDTVIRNYNWFRYESIGSCAYPPAVDLIKR